MFGDEVIVHLTDAKGKMENIEANEDEKGSIPTQEDQVAPTLTR